MTQIVQFFRTRLSAWWALLFVLGLSVTLSACGFQLRGNYQFQFNSIGLHGMEKTELWRTMALQLDTNNLAVNPTKPAAPLSLNLLREHRERSIITFSSSGRASEVRLTYKLEYSVTDQNGDFLIATTALSQRRELAYNDEQLLSKETEENELYQEMQQDMARQIIRRLSTLTPPPANKGPAP